MNKGQAGAFRWIMIALVVVFVGLFIYGLLAPPDIYVPQNLKVGTLHPTLANILTAIGVPSQWQFMPAIIYYLFVPLLGIIVITYGFLDSMRIFPRNDINVILAIIFGVAIIPFGVFTRIVGTLFALMGVYSIGAFVFLFALGVVYVVLERRFEWGFSKFGKYTELQREGQFKQLRNLLEEVHHIYSGSSSKKIRLQATLIPELLNKGQKKLDAGDADQAVRILRDEANKVIGNLATAGAPGIRRFSQDLRNIAS